MKYRLKSDHSVTCEASQQLASGDGGKIMDYAKMLIGDPSQIVWTPRWLFHKVWEPVPEEKPATSPESPWPRVDDHANVSAGGPYPSNPGEFIQKKVTVLRGDEPSLHGEEINQWTAGADPRVVDCMKAEAAEIASAAGNEDVLRGESPSKPASPSPIPIEDEFDKIVTEGKSVGYRSVDSSLAYGWLLRAASEIRKLIDSVKDLVRDKVALYERLSATVADRDRLQAENKQLAEGGGALLGAAGRANKELREAVADRDRLKDEVDTLSKRPAVVETTIVFKGRKVFFQAMGDGRADAYIADCFNKRVNAYIDDRWAWADPIRPEPKSEPPKPRKVRLMLPWQSPGTEPLYPVEATIEELE